MIFLLLIIVVWAVAWFVFVVPSRRRRAAHSAMQDSVGIGDEVITAGGLHAVVQELGEDTLRVEIAPGVVATLDRRAVAAVAREVEVEVDHEELEGEAEDDSAFEEHGTVGQHGDGSAV